MHPAPSSTMPQLQTIFLTLHLKITPLGTKNTIYNFIHHNTMVAQFKKKTLTKLIN